MGISWRIAKIGRLSIRIDGSWVIIFALVTWSLAVSYFPQQYRGWSPFLYWGVGLATSLLFFASVLGHELAHSLVALWQGMEVESITLFIFGGVARIREEMKSPLTEILLAFAGPLASLTFSALFAFVWAFGHLFMAQPLAALARYLFIINGMVALFNLIPGFPLDGGRILRAGVWWLTGDLRGATRLASGIGQGVAFLLIFVGVWSLFRGDLGNGLWLVFIGWFLHDAARASYRQLVMRDILREMKVGDLMSRDFQPVESGIPLSRLADEYILRSRDHAYPVVDEEELLGIICLHDVKAVPRERWPTTTVKETMTPRAQLVIVSPRDDCAQAIKALSEHNIRQLPVLEEGRLVGLLRRSDVLNAVRMRQELT